METAGDLLGTLPPETVVGDPIALPAVQRAELGHALMPPRRAVPVGTFPELHTTATMAQELVNRFLAEHHPALLDAAIAPRQVPGARCASILGYLFRLRRSRFDPR